MGGDVDDLSEIIPVMFTISVAFDFSVAVVV